MSESTYQVKSSGNQTPTQTKTNNNNNLSVQAKEENNSTSTSSTPEYQGMRPGVIMANIQRSLNSGNYPFPPAPIQPKLTIGAPGDRYEQEADRVASEVVQRINSSETPNNNENNNTIQRKPQISILQRIEETQEELQMKMAQNIIQTKGGMVNIQADFESTLNSARSGGTLLDQAFRAKVEPQMGADFSSVRVHTDSTAHNLSQSIQAKAFTTGKDIFFKQGTYDPHSRGGQELLAHELTHVVQQNSDNINNIQRKSLTTEEILTDLQKISFIKNKLKQNITAIRDKDWWTIPLTDKKAQQEDQTKRMAKGETMFSHIEKVLSNYETHFSDGQEDSINNAMMIVMALDGVARVVAEEIGDPTIQHQLTTELLLYYRGDIESKISKKQLNTKDKQESLDLAQVLAINDPVSRYMHNEIRKEQAAYYVNFMAKQARIKPLEMFNLLNQRFQAQIASYNRKQIQETQDKGFKSENMYTLSESPGELSERYFNFLFGEKVDQPVWKENEDDQSSLEFTENAQTKLDELENYIKQPPEKSLEKLVPRQGLKTAKQEQHLQEIETQEQKINRDSIKEQLSDAFMDIFGLVESEAKTLVDDVDKWLKQSALTITINGKKWFSQELSADQSVIKPATANAPDSKELQKVLGKSSFFTKSDQRTIEHSSWKDMPGYEARGKNYMRFRQWKDNLMTGLLDFSAEEMPVFGALNINWEGAWGGDADPTQMPNMLGKNYYGDAHLKLKRANVENRLVYTATDHGTPRRDPLLALHDFAFGGESASLTKLKDTKKIEIIAMVVNATRLHQSIYSGAGLMFEIQIFGDVNISEDVEKIYLSSDTSPEVESNVQKFSKKTNVPYEKITRNDVGNPVVMKGDPDRGVKLGLAQSGLKSTQKVEKLDNFQFEFTGKRVQDFQLMAFNILNKNPISSKDTELIKKEFLALEKNFESLKKSVEADPKAKEAKVIDRLETLFIELKNYVEEVIENQRISDWEEYMSERRELEEL